MLISSGLVAAGLLLLVGGGEILLRGAVGLATLARVTPAVIGLTVVAAGTSVFAGYGHGTRLPDPQERYIAVFSYYEKPGVMFSKEEQIGFYGRAA